MKTEGLKSDTSRIRVPTGMDTEPSDSLKIKVLPGPASTTRGLGEVNLTKMAIKRAVLKSS
jgi:hypothetical protein